MAMGKNLFQLISLEFADGSIENLKTDLVSDRCWTGEVIFNRYSGRPIHFHSTADYIINEKDEPVAIMFVYHNINDIKKKERQLAAAEKEYATLVNTLFDGVLMIKSDGKITACNKRAAEILGLTEEELLGKVTASPSWNAVKEDGSEFPLSEFPAIICLHTGLPQRNIVMGVEQPDGTKVWLLVNSQALFHPGDTKPYAAVASFSDITDKLKSEEALRKSNERFFYAGKVTSDAIWDIDLETNEIYRSEAFSSFSGYTKEQTEPNLDWWFNKVHPEDRERVKNKVNESIRRGITEWQDEYRFQCADGNFKYLLDSGIILYKDGKPVRIIGAIQDLTERKELEARLLHEEIQKQKQVNQATIAAQEQERNNISKELHDNVNQILMSAKLFMNTAQRNPAQSKELLEKAVEYQLLALEEIRKLSKSLSTSLVKTVGLKESVADIVYNMETLQNLDVQFKFNSRVEDKLSNEQKLMLFRIIQEQTSNIIKYAEARSVQIFINETRGIVHLVISDDGKGFDVEQKGKGIGFVNIFSRADAYNGRISIISSPGNGCTLELRFPVKA
jgi:PAS domain S-box-containing protein